MFIYKYHDYYVYIVTDLAKKVIYTGVTNNLEQRLIEHWLDRGNKKTFAGRNHCYNLIYYEYFTYINNAIQREKELKGWSREKKEWLIQFLNPKWKFLNMEFCKIWPPTDSKKRDSGWF